MHMALWSSVARRRSFGVSAVLAVCAALATGPTSLASPGVTTAVADDPTLQAARVMENLGRGVVAVRSGSTQVLVSWRLLGLDPEGIGFDVYRSTGGGAYVKLNASVLTGGTNYTDSTADLTRSNSYRVVPVVGGQEQAPSGAFTLTADHATEPVVRVPLRSGGPVKFVWVGDLDGDGEYDYVLDRQTSPRSSRRTAAVGSFSGRSTWGRTARTRTTSNRARP